jgi:hypothetical protein
VISSAARWKGHDRSRAPAGVARRKQPPARSAKLEALVDELERAAIEAGIRVRRERLLREVGYHARSGLCRVRDERLLLIDSDLEPDGQIELLLEALDGHDLERLPLSEDARRLIAPSQTNKPKP